MEFDGSRLLGAGQEFEDLFLNRGQPLPRKMRPYTLPCAERWFACNLPQNLEQVWISKVSMWFQVKESQDEGIGSSQSQLPSS